MRCLLLMVLGLGGATLFILGLSLDNTALRMLAKPLPLIALLLWLRRAPRGHYRRWISLGLLWSLIGDLLLEVPVDLFILGLGAFLLAHLCFLCAYWDDTHRPAWPALILATVLGLGVFSLLASQGLGPLRVPVALYALAISAMLWRAWARLGVVSRRSAGFGAFGALLFVLSDSLIGVNRFVLPFAGADLAIILSYWLGQLAIAASAHERRA